MSVIKRMMVRLKWTKKRGVHEYFESISNDTSAVSVSSSEVSTI